jgi:hypothetical protein
MALISGDKSLTHADFVRFTVGQIIQISPAISLPAVTRRLKIEADDLQRLLPTFGEHNPEPRFFFVIGRPCSGKTTVAEAILCTSASKKIDAIEASVQQSTEVLLYRTFPFSTRSLSRLTSA